MRPFNGSRTKTCAAILVAVAALYGSPGALARPKDPPNDPGRGPILELDVTNLPDLKEGQPAVAVNPTKPSNLVFTATIFNAAHCAIPPKSDASRGMFPRVFHG